VPLRSRSAAYAYSSVATRRPSIAGLSSAELRAEPPRHASPTIFADEARQRPAPPATHSPPCYAARATQPNTGEHCKGPQEPRPRPAKAATTRTANRDRQREPSNPSGVHASPRKEVDCRNLAVELELGGHADEDSAATHPARLPGARRELCSAQSSAGRRATVGGRRCAFLACSCPQRSAVRTRCSNSRPLRLSGSVGRQAMHPHSAS
jgi:hypothetical protein